MARFAPDAPLDRFTVEACAHRLRNEEIDRLLAAAARWLALRRRQWAADVAGYARLAVHPRRPRAH